MTRWSVKYGSFWTFVFVISFWLSSERQCRAQDTRQCFQVHSGKVTRQQKIQDCSRIINDNSSPSQYKGRAYSARCVYTDSIDDCENAGKINKDDAYFVALANVYKHKGEYAKADRSLAAAYRESPLDKGILLNLWNLRSKERRYGEAKIFLEQAAKIAPDDFEVIAAQGLMAFHEGQYNDALTRFADLDRSDQMSAPEYLAKGEILLTQKDWNNGSKNINAAVDLDDRLLGLRGFYMLPTLARERGYRDLMIASSKDPDDMYLALQIDYAETRLDKPNSLASRSSGFDFDKWPGPIISYRLGQIGLSQLRNLAVAGDKDKTTGQICEVDFYVGLHEFLANKGDLAKSETMEGLQMLREARETCPRDFVEFVFVSTLSF